MVTALSGLIVGALTTPAAAGTDRANGYYVEPGQQHAGNPNGAPEWLGSYRVNGEPVFCVDYQLKAPDTDERYEPGDKLLTKWGNPLPTDRAAKISYLLLRYGDTDNDTTAGAVAHLLHSWTADPAYEGGGLGKDVPAEKVAYDIDFHAGTMTTKQRTRVNELKAEAEKFRGPWNARLSAPEDEQQVGTAGEWTIRVETASGDGVPDIPVTVEFTGARLSDHGDTATETEDESGHSGNSGDNGDNEATGDSEHATNGTNARAAGTDDGTGDSTADQDSTATVTTGDDGTATIDVTPTAEKVTAHLNVRAPAPQPRVQEPIEDGIQTVVATGGEQELNAAQTLAAQPRPQETTTSTTTVEVPRTIPAGGQPNAVVQGEATTQVPTGTIMGVGALLLLGSMLTGWIARRRFGSR